MLNFAWFWPIYTDELLTHARVAGPDLVHPLDLTLTSLVAPVASLACPA